MRHEVDARNDLVTLDDGYQTTVDCSELRADDVMYAELGDEEFVEREPFNGRETDYDFSKVEAVVNAAIDERDAPPSLEEAKADQIAAINRARKDEEAQGIMLNDVRYSGSQGNRQSLREAIEYAEDVGKETFSTWKDSDNNYHDDHPLADVKEALSLIAENRDKLIGKEATKVAQIKEAETVKEVQAITWDL